jgi:hypothetical protein
MAARKGKEIGAEMQRKSDCIDALATFDTTLKRRPNRLGATIGRPKRPRGSTSPKAAPHYGAALALTESADPVRRTLARRAFVAQQN